MGALSMFQSMMEEVVGMFPSGKANSDIVVVFSKRFLEHVNHVIKMVSILCQSTAQR